MTSFRDVVPEHIDRISTVVNLLDVHRIRTLPWEICPCHKAICIMRLVQGRSNLENVGDITDVSLPELPSHTNLIEVFWQVRLCLCLLHIHLLLFDQANVKLDLLLRLNAVFF